MTLGFDKKGQNILMVIPLIAIIAVVAIIGFTIFSDLNSEIQVSEDFPDVSKEESQKLHDAYPGMLDSIVLTAILAVLIGSIITAFLAKFNTVFAFITVFLMLGLLILPMIVSDVWQDLVANPEIAAESLFPITSFIMNYFPFVYLGLILLVGIAYTIGDRFT